MIHWLDAMLEDLEILAEEMDFQAMQATDAEDVQHFRTHERALRRAINFLDGLPREQYPTREAANPLNNKANL